MTKFIFDISTSARWSGHPVGIVRVERELCRRAQKHLSDDLAFSVYDLKAGNFRIVHDRYVESILNGEISIDFGTDPAPARASVRKGLRNLSLRIPAAYRFIQRLRGFHFSAEDVRVMRERVRFAEANTLAANRRLTLAQATKPCSGLGPDTVIVSGGLDWEHKNIRQIYRLKKKTGFRFISIVYDLIPIYLPHYVVPYYVSLLTEYFGELLWASDGCLCISETTRIDLHKFCDENNVARMPAQAFPLGADLASAAGLEVLPSNLDGKRFVLYVSTIEPRKNHRTAYEAWCHALLAGKLDPKTDRLVFVGRQGWNVGDLVHEMTANPLTRDTVILLANVSDSLLKTLYQGCAFVIFPSYYEGYGLPLAESFANGKICLTSGAGALREIGSPFRIDIDPRDVIKWSVTISELMNDPEKLHSLEAEVATQYRGNSWDQSAQYFFDTLKKWFA